MASISTTALRLAAIEALAPTDLILAGATTGWPTVLGPRIFDSGATTHDRVPSNPGDLIAAVYTDEMRGDPRGEEYGYAPQDLIVDLVFDLEIPILGEDGSLLVALADADASAKLELAAAQIRRVLARSPLLVPRLVKSFGRIEARWTRDPDLGVRLARLTLRIPCAIDDDDWEEATDGLPSPASLVAAAMPAASYGAGILAQIAAAWTDPAELPRLAEIRLGLAVGAEAEAPSDVEAAAVRAAVDLT